MLRSPDSGRTRRRIAAPRAKVNDRAGRWVTAQVGSDGRSVAEVARELGCDWHTVMDAVVVFGEPLIDDTNRFGAGGGRSRRDALRARGSLPAPGVVDADR